MTRGVVVDASAIVELVAVTPVGARVERFLRGATLAAPAHLDAEVFSALTRMARHDPTQRKHIRARLAAVARARIRRYPCGPLLVEAWALTDNVAARDALYVQLARRLGHVLVTADERLSRAPASVLDVTVQLA